MPLNYPFNHAAKTARLITDHEQILYLAGFLTLCIGLTLVVGCVVFLFLDVRQPRRTTPAKAIDLPAQTFGSGSRKDFGWYFEGQSQVTVSSIDEICAWLRECEYIHDQVLFMQQDFWQHPITFEQIRRGDCEDHALWAWRKMKELGISAEFIVGEVQDVGYHAWVVFKHQDHRYLLESTQKSGKMIYPLRRTKQIYRPDVGIDHGLKTYRYTTQN